MMPAYQPEIGQMAFGQPSKSFAVPDIMDAVLVLLQYRVQTHQWNINQKEMPDPFSNSGGSFKCDAFEVQAYDWGEEYQPFNFKWNDLEVSWYKYLGRGMSANKDISPEIANDCLMDCLSCLERMDEMEE